MNTNLNHAIQSARSNIKFFLSLFGVVLLVILAYSNSLDIPFYFDDLLHIVDNPHIRMTELSWDALWEAAQESPHRQRFIIYLTFAFLLTDQLVVLERIAGMTALVRSRELMRGSMLRALGILLFVFLVFTVLTTGLTLVVGQIPVLGTIGAAAAQAVYLAYLAVVLVLLYFDVRCRQEDFDLQHMAELVEQRAIPALTDPR